MGIEAFMGENIFLLYQKIDDAALMLTKTVPRVYVLFFKSETRETFSLFFFFARLSLCVFFTEYVWGCLEMQGC